MNDYPTTKQVVYDYAMRLALTPYKWGGANFTGLDCSGMVILLLQAAGVFPMRQDATAGEIATRYNAVPFSKSALELFGFGTLLFYGNPISHITFALNGCQMISAEGGDHTTLTKEDAQLKNAFVKVLPTTARGVPTLMATPAYAW